MSEDEVCDCGWQLSAVLHTPADQARRPRIVVPYKHWISNQIKRV